MSFSRRNFVAFLITHLHSFIAERVLRSNYLINFPPSSPLPTLCFPLLPLSFFSTLRLAFGPRSQPFIALHAFLFFFFFLLSLSSFFFYRFDSLSPAAPTLLLLFLFLHFFFFCFFSVEIARLFHLFSTRSRFLYDSFII